VNDIILRTERDTFSPILLRATMSGVDDEDVQYVGDEDELDDANCGDHHVEYDMVNDEKNLRNLLGQYQIS